MILEKIKKPNDIHKVSLEDFPRLARGNQELFDPECK